MGQCRWFQPTDNYQPCKCYPYFWGANEKNNLWNHHTDRHGVLNVRDIWWCVCMRDVIGKKDHVSIASVVREIRYWFPTEGVYKKIPVTIQGVYLCSLFCRYKAVCDTLGLQNDHQKIYLVYILGSTGFLQNDLVFLQGQHGKITPNKTSYVNPRMHFVGFSNSRQTWGII